MICKIPQADIITSTIEKVYYIIFINFDVHILGLYIINEFEIYKYKLIKFIIV